MNEQENTFFPYGKDEIEYLKKKDKKLAEVIDQIGHIERAVDEDLFSSVIHHIIGQQISTKAQQSIFLGSCRWSNTGNERLFTKTFKEKDKKGK